MPVRKSKNVAINKRREQVADLYLQGKTQMEISEVVGVGQPTVSSDLKRIQAQWRESSVRDFDLARELELRKIDRIEREAWAAWERSKKPAQSATTSDEPNQRRTRRHVKNQYGDPRFLEQVHKCVSARRALLGLDAPVRTEIETNEFSSLERRDRIVTVLAAIRDRRGTQVLGAGPGHPEPRLLCADRQPGTLEGGASSQLP
jgi:hypothetical protein